MTSSTDATDTGEDPADLPPQADATGDTDGDRPSDDERPGGRGRSRVLRMARRLMDRRELAEDTKELMFNVLATSDKAKTEAVRLVAREARNWLDALELKEILTGYSLEISINLKPLADALEGDDEPED